MVVNNEITPSFQDIRIMVNNFQKQKIASHEKIFEFWLLKCVITI